MSTIIAVCGTNFCTFAADTRKVIPNGNGWKVDNDTTEKVFKINDKVLFGAAGLFDLEEKLLSPFEGIANLQSLTLQNTCEIVLDYMNKNAIRIARNAHRNYLAGGKDGNGSFCIYEIHYNKATNTIDVTQRRPTPPNSSFAVSMALPFMQEKNTQLYLNMVADGIKASKTHSELTQKMAAVIRIIADDDITVGKNVTCVNIF